MAGAPDVNRSPFVVSPSTFVESSPSNFIVAVAVEYHIDRKLCATRAVSSLQRNTTVSSAYC